MEKGLNLTNVCLDIINRPINICTYIQGIIDMRKPGWWGMNREKIEKCFIIKCIPFAKTSVWKGANKNRQGMLQSF